MTTDESSRFDNALINLFSEYQIKIIKAIFAGEGNLNQEDVIRTSEEGIIILRKLRWYRRVKTAIKRTGLHLIANNQIII